RILGAEHGTARLAADGQTLLFTPEAGFAGDATLRLQADDGFAMSGVIELKVKVSGAKLTAIRLERLASLATGGANQLQAIGDFEDEANVQLDGHYLSWSSDHPDLLTVDAEGRVRGLATGHTVVHAKARGIEGFNAFSVDTNPGRPLLDEDGFEVDVYPKAIELPAEVGQRQLKVHTLDGTRIDAATSGIRYLVSDPRIAEVSADGLIHAKAVGSTTISVIYQGLQRDLIVRVETPQTGPTDIAAGQGVIVQDAAGNLLMLAPGSLPAAGRVSIQAVEPSSLGLPLPAAGVLDTLGAVHLDLGGQEARLPLQLALKVASPQAVGTEVLFWAKGQIVDANGVSHDTWWLLDNGRIGADGIARTSSPPFEGLTKTMDVVATVLSKSNPDTGEMEVTHKFMEWDSIWAPAENIAVAARAMAGASGEGFSGMMRALRDAFLGITTKIDGSYQTKIPTTVKEGKVRFEFPPVPANPRQLPDITGFELDRASGQIRLQGSHFLPEGSNSNQYQLKLWLKPRADALAAPTQRVDDRGLSWQAVELKLNQDKQWVAQLPAGLSLSQHIGWVERIALTPGFGQKPSASQRLSGEAVELWQPNQPAAVIASRHWKTQENQLHLFRPTAEGLSLVRSLVKDEKGQPLQLNSGKADAVAFSEDGTLAFVAGQKRIYVIDLMAQAVVYTHIPAGLGSELSSLGVQGDWLYYTEGSRNNPQGGRLLRLNIRPGAAGYLRTSQDLSLPVEARFGYQDMAISSGRYLALTASQLSAPNTWAGLDDEAWRQPGNVYVVDLQQVGADGRIPGTAWHKLDRYTHADSQSGSGGTGGKAPVNLSEGLSGADFLLSSALDRNFGLAGVHWDLDDQGRPGQLGTAKGTALTPLRTDPEWYDRQHQLNIQRAQGSVMVAYQGEEYALVADYHFSVNDPHVLYGTDVGNQIGGKIGVIRDPLGKNGGPEYLGATTPIPGTALNQLSLSGDGRLYATGFIYEPSLTNPATGPADAVFGWDIAKLLNAAIEAKAHPRRYAIPLDRQPTGGIHSAPRPDLLPARYNGPAANQVFGRVFGMGIFKPGVEVTDSSGMAHDGVVVFSPYAPGNPFVLTPAIPKVEHLADKTTVLPHSNLPASPGVSSMRAWADKIEPEKADQHTLSWRNYTGQPTRFQISVESNSFLWKGKPEQSDALSLGNKALLAGKGKDLVVEKSVELKPGEVFKLPVFSKLDIQQVQKFTTADAIVDKALVKTQAIDSKGNLTGPVSNSYKMVYVADLGDADPNDRTLYFSDTVVGAIREKKIYNPAGLTLVARNGKYFKVVENSWNEKDRTTTVQYWAREDKDAVADIDVLDIVEDGKVLTSVYLAAQTVPPVTLNLNMAKARAALTAAFVAINKRIPEPKRPNPNDPNDPNKVRHKRWKDLQDSTKTLIDMQTKFGFANGQISNSKWLAFENMIVSEVEKFCADFAKPHGHSGRQYVSLKIVRNGPAVDLSKRIMEATYSDDVLGDLGEAWLNLDFNGLPINNKKLSASAQLYMLTQAFQGDEAQKGHGIETIGIGAELRSISEDVDVYKYKIKDPYSEFGQRLSRVYVHELGHLLGLPDEYGADANQTPIFGKPNFMTAQDSERVDLNMRNPSQRSMLSFGLKDPMFNPALKDVGNLVSEVKKIKENYDLRHSGPSKLVSINSGNTTLQIEDPSGLARVGLPLASPAVVTAHSTLQPMLGGLPPSTDLQESGSSRLVHSFTSKPQDRYLRFTVADQALIANSSGPSDAFQVALLNANTGASLVGSTGMANSDALLNIQTGGAEKLASGVRKQLNGDGTVTYFIDLKHGVGGDLAGTPALLSFDLIGFGSEQSHVAIRDIQLVQNVLAFDDTASLDEDSALELRPLVNDLGADASARIELVSQPAQGSVVVNGDGSLRYQPAANWSGTETIQYRYTADGSTSNVATITLTVRPVNDAPLGVDSQGSVVAGQSFIFHPLTGAKDVDGDSLSAHLNTGPAHGQVSRHADGSWSYIADRRYSGPDQFTYYLNDGQADSAPVTVTLTVLPANTAPTARDGVLSLLEDGSVRIDLRQFGSDAESDVLTGRITAQPQHGTLTAQADGSWLYTPTANYAGEDAIRFILNDGQLDSAEAVLKLNIQAVVDAPVFKFGTVQPRELFRTSWESAPNPDRSSTVISDSLFEGWTLVTTGDVQAGGKNGFEVWSSGDSMSNQRNQPVTVTAMAGNGQNWLELNDAAGTQTQTLGIERQIDTVAGAHYRLSLDLAGRPGFGAAYTAIGVYVDEQRIASFTQSSVPSKLTWQTDSALFLGKGGRQTLRIVTEAQSRDPAGRGMMLDDLSLSESFVYNEGRSGSPIRLLPIELGTGDADGSETSHLELLGLPVGSRVSDGSHSHTVTVPRERVKLAGWQLDRLAITPPLSYRGELPLELIATAIESQTGQTASLSQTLTLLVLPAPLAMNPLVSVASAPPSSTPQRVWMGHWQNEMPHGQTSLQRSIDVSAHLEQRFKQLDKMILDTLLRELSSQKRENQ
ncbi:tandem-95 repeat protein, partial [Parachitinimonas caeni]